MQKMPWFKKTEIPDEEALEPKLEKISLASSSKKEVNFEFVACKTKSTYKAQSQSHDIVDKLQASVCRKADERLSHSLFCQVRLTSPSTLRQSKPNVVLLLGHHPACENTPDSISSGANYLAHTLI